MVLDLEAFILMWKIKYGNTDNAWQKVMSGEEIREVGKIIIVVKIGGQDFLTMLRRIGSTCTCGNKMTSLERKALLGHELW